MTITEGERVAVLEANMQNIEKRMQGIEVSLNILNGKVDTFIKLISDGYVSTATFNEYKKSRLLERILIILVTAAISGLVAFVLRANNV